MRHHVTRFWPWPGAAGPLSVTVLCAAALLAGGAAARPTNAAPAFAGPPVVLVQLTDTHMGTYASPEEKERRLARLRQLIADINTVIRPDAVIGTGDWVSEPTLAAYTELAQELARLQVPFYPVRGNHDSPGDLFARIFGPRELAFDAGGWRIVGLDDPPRSFHWLDFELQRQAAHGPLLLFSHRPLATPPDLVLPPIDGGWTLPEPMRTQLISRMVAYDVPAWVSGHVHEPFIAELGDGAANYGAPATALRSAYHVFVLEGRQVAVGSGEVGRWPLVVPVQPAARQGPTSIVGSLPLRVRVFAATPVTSASYRLDAGPWIPLDFRGNGVWEATWTPSAAQAGEHRLTFRAVTAGGRASDAGVSVAVYPDGQPLNVGLVSPAEGALLEGLVGVRLSVSGGGEQRQVCLYVDGERRLGPAAVAPGQTEALVAWDTSLECTGDHRVWVKAVDERGQASCSQPLAVRIAGGRTDSPPAVALRPLPAVVFGVVPLAAEAGDDQGVAGIGFQYRPAGADAWQPIAWWETIDHVAATPQAYPHTAASAARWLTVGLPNGSYEVRALAEASAGCERVASAAAQVWVDNGQAGAVLARAVSAAEDDISQLDGERWLGSSHLAVGGNAWTAVRFRNLPIPPGARIVSATLALAANGTQSREGWVSLRGEAQADPSPYNSAPLAWRALGNQEVRWELSGRWLGGTWRSSPDLAGVIQELIAHPGWAAGNALALMLLPTGGTAWQVHSYETGGTALAPQLAVQWVGPALGSPTPAATEAPTPAATATPSPTAMPTATMEPGPTATPPLTPAPLPWRHVYHPIVLAGGRPGPPASGDLPADSGPLP